MPITSISLYLDWMDKIVCLAVQDRNWEQAQKIADNVGDTILFGNEKAMLDAFTLIDDADILSGWNSEGYDILYCKQNY